MGVIVVMYRSSDVIADCLASLLKSRRWLGRIVLVDNASPDDSADVAADIAAEHRCSVIERAPHENTAISPNNSVEIVRSAENLGFAGGVNLGLHLLQQDQQTEFFWILNPDCELSSGAAETALGAARAGEAAGGFALMGTRIRYREGAQSIQSDGAVYCRWTGRCRNLNQGRAPADANAYEDAECDFISGASMIASRRFVAQAGCMPEDYFLYYEEVDWALQRGSLPLLRSLDSVVFHQGGTAIGSGSTTRAPSPMSCYFNFRNRIWFIRRYHPGALVTCYGSALLKIAQFLARCRWRQSIAAFSGMCSLAPPKDVAAAFPPSDRAKAFGSATPKAAQTTTTQQLGSHA